VAQAVEAGEVPADRLAELRAEFEATRTKPPEQSCADSVQDIAAELKIPVEKVEASSPDKGSYPGTSKRN
jgi:hypothetical protein